MINFKKAPTQQELQAKKDEQSAKAKHRDLIQDMMRETPGEGLMMVQESKPKDQVQVQQSKGKKKQKIIVENNSANQDIMDREEAKQLVLEIKAENKKAAEVPSIRQKP